MSSSRRWWRWRRGRPRPRRRPRSRRRTAGRTSPGSAAGWTAMEVSEKRRNPDCLGNCIAVVTCLEMLRIRNNIINLLAGIERASYFHATFFLLPVGHLDDVENEEGRVREGRRERRRRRRKKSFLREPSPPPPLSHHHLPPPPPPPPGLFPSTPSFGWPQVTHQEGLPDDKVGFLAAFLKLLAH